jgi:hypothetical protein
MTAALAVMLNISLLRIAFSLEKIYFACLETRLPWDRG